MTELEFKDGKYYLGGAAGTPFRQVHLLVPILMAVVALAGISFSLIQGRGKAPGAPDFSELMVFFPVLIIVGGLLISTALMRRMGRVVIDPPAAEISFSRITQRGTSRAVVRWSSVKSIVLTARNGAWVNRPGTKLYVIRLMTIDGEEDLVSLQDEAETRRLAQQIAGIISCSFLDLT